MTIEEMDDLTTMQWLRDGHSEEAITFLTRELTQQKKRIAELEEFIKSHESDMR